MKKVLVVLIAVILGASCIGCSSSPKVASNSASSGASPTQSENSSQPKDSSEQGVEVDKGLADVSITLPASLFQGESFKQIKEAAEKEGIKNITKNKDGSITFKMSKSDHKKILENMKKSTADDLDKMSTSGDFKSVQEVKYDDDFSNVTIVVDKAKYENSFDSFSALGVGIAGMLYQEFEGKKQDEVSVKIDYVDKNTKKVFSTVKYPEALNESSK